MLTEREKQMATILQRLAEWDELPIGHSPTTVLRGIMKDSEELLVEYGLPRYPEPRLFVTEPASASSEETSEPSKNPPPEDR